MSYTRQAFKYNNTELIYTHSIYVSPEGNDSSGEGTREKPYKTIQFATSKLFNDTTAIVLLPGIYNENPYQNTNIIGYSNPSVISYENESGVMGHTGKPYYSFPKLVMNKGLFMSFEYKANFIGYSNETIINTQFNEEGCCIVLPGIKKDVTMYGITVNIECNFSMKNSYDSNCIIGTHYQTQSTYIYNCAFRYISNFENERGIFHGCYNTNENRTNAINYMYNCVIDMGDIYNAFAGNRQTTFYQQKYDRYHGWYEMSQEIRPDEAHQKAKLIATNCIFLNIQNWLSIKSTTSSPYIEMVNCIYPNIDKLYQITDTNCLKNDTKLDDDYYPLQSDVWKFSGRTDLKNPDNTISNIGLYGGLYAWVKTLSNKAEITFTNFDDLVSKESKIDSEFTITPPMVNECVKDFKTFSGNFLNFNDLQYKYPFYKNEWNKIDRIEIL